MRFNQRIQHRRRLANLSLGIGLGVTQGGGVIFGPSSVSGLQLDLNPALGTWQDNPGTVVATADGDPVKLWQDQSGQAHHVSAASDTVRPTLQTLTNGGKTFRTIRTDGTDDRLTAAFTLAQPCTLLIVAKRTGGTGVDGYTDAQNANSFRGVYRNSSDTSLQLFAGSAFTVVTTSQAVLNAFICIFNGASSVLNFNGAETTGGNVGASAGSGICLGGGLGGNILGGDYARVLAWAGAVGSGDRTSLIAWARSNYGTP